MGCLVALSHFVS
jgi:hypothetical protein